MKALAWGRLLRLSLAPSAAADVAAGLCLGAWGVLPPRLESLLLVLASLCVYHGGMALNDWADRAEDARTRPDRPLPSGAISARSAQRAALGLLIAGPVLALLATPAAGAWMLVVALLAALYDLRGRGRWLGPSLLAVCRGMNMGAGVLLGSQLVSARIPQAPRWAFVACGLYGAYVFFASRLGRLEDDADPGPLGRRPSRYLSAAAACLVAVPLLPIVVYQPVFFSREYATWRPGGLALAGFAAVGLALVGVGAAGLLRAARTAEWTRPQVGRATGLALRRLLVFTAACAWMSIVPVMQANAPFVAGWPAQPVAALILLGYPVSLALRSVFPPT